MTINQITSYSHSTLDPKNKCAGEEITSKRKKIVTKNKDDLFKLLPIKKRYNSEISYSDYNRETQKKPKFNITIQSEHSFNQRPINKDLFFPDEKVIDSSDKLSPIEAILELEKLEKSIPFDDPNHGLYLFTPVVEEILDPASRLPKQITILTGQLEPYLVPPGTSKELRANLKTAKKIIDFVKDSVPFSGNFLQRSRIFSEDYYDPEIAKIVETATLLVQNDSFYLNPMQYTKKILEYKTGNCVELSLVALLQDKNVMLVEVINGNHAFVIVGCTTNPSNNRILDFNALIHDPYAVICDPWTGSNYPASMLEKQLFNYVDQVEVDGRLYTQVAAFDSSKESLSIIYSPD
jgi:hypothetical protein